MTVGLEIAVATVQPPVPMAFPRAEAGREAHARHRNAYPRFLVMSYNAASPAGTKAGPRTAGTPGWLGGSHAPSNGSAGTPD